MNSNPPGVGLGLGERKRGRARAHRGQGEVGQRQTTPTGGTAGGRWQPHKRRGGPPR